MARKRASLAHLDYDSPEYWNRLLTEEGLSMEALKADRRDVSYVGTSNDIVPIEQNEYMNSFGKVRPKDGTRPVKEPETSLDAVNAELELKAAVQKAKPKTLVPLHPMPRVKKLFCFECDSLQRARKIGTTATVYTLACGHTRNRIPVPDPVAA